jgi:hypothetical protein
VVAPPRADVAASSGDAPVPATDRPARDRVADEPSPGTGGVPGGVMAAAASAAPPAAVAAVLVALLALAAFGFSTLVVPPAGRRPVGYVSLLERPG